MTVECLFVVVRYNIIFYYDPKKQVEAVDERAGVVLGDEAINLVLVLTIPRPGKTIVFLPLKS